MPWEDKEKEKKDWKVFGNLNGTQTSSFFFFFKKIRAKQNHLTDF